MAELLPCPFCGGEAELKRGKLYFDDTVQIHCTECHIHTPKIAIECYMWFDGKWDYMTEEMAIERSAKRWNRRANNEQQQTNASRENS